MTDTPETVFGDYSCACERWTRVLDYSNGQWIETRDSIFTVQELTMPDSTHLSFWNGVFYDCDPSQTGMECSDYSYMLRVPFITLYPEEQRLEYRELLNSPSSWHGAVQCDCTKQD